MTAHKHLKETIRARMRKTGESYTTARRHIVRQVEVLKDSSPTRWHLPGNIPATTALRVLLTAAGVRDPRDGNPLSEAMLFGICGGIGLGMASFIYEKENFSSFYVGGRHLWNDDLAYMQATLGRFGIKAIVHEGKAASLRNVLAGERPCIAWVDMQGLPHRGMPAFLSGGGYHVVTVYRMDEERSVAFIGDLTDVPLEIGLKDFAAARTRIKQFKNRLMTVSELKNGDVDLSALVRSGLQACHHGLKRDPSRKGASAMSGLEMLQKWLTQLTQSKAKDTWAKAFPRGQRLWQGLTSIYDFIENYHTGGGLCRDLFAEFLEEASPLPGCAQLRPLSRRYAKLGALWSDLAISAIPQSVPAFHEVRELCVQRAELRSGGDPADVETIRKVWDRLAELQKDAERDFPLSLVECAELQELLRGKVAALRDAELVAHASLGEAITAK